MAIIVTNNLVKLELHMYFHQLQVIAHCYSHFLPANQIDTHKIQTCFLTACTEAYQKQLYQLTFTPTEFFNAVQHIKQILTSAKDC
jgi:hypothetical protein